MRAHLGGPLELDFLSKILKFRVGAQVGAWAGDTLIPQSQALYTFSSNLNPYFLINLIR